VQNNITDVETGLILRIQPLINDDGVVVMNLDAERSRLGEATDGVVVAFGNDGEPILSPPIERTTAQTTVSAKSGQTVVFAGLITEADATDVRRVPYLADIPVVGKVFEYTTNIERRTELLIIMTPYIIQDDEDYEWIKMMESERMSWCLADVVEMHGDVGLQGYNCMFCEHEVPCLFPHHDPMGTGMCSGSGRCAHGCGADKTISAEFRGDAAPQDIDDQGPNLAPIPTAPETTRNELYRQGPPVEVPASYVGPAAGPGQVQLAPTTVTYGPPPPGAGVPWIPQTSVQRPSASKRSSAPARRLPEVR
jgi:hypothetical protein